MKNASDTRGFPYWKFEKTSCPSKNFNSKKPKTGQRVIDLALAWLQSYQDPALSWAESSTRTGQAGTIVLL